RWSTGKPRSTRRSVGSRRRLPSRTMRRCFKRRPLSRSCFRIDSPCPFGTATHQARTARRCHVRPLSVFVYRDNVHEGGSLPSARETFGGVRLHSSVVVSG